MITNLINSRGNAVKNQFVIFDEKRNTITFQSYQSTICIVDNNGGLGFDRVVTIGKDWNYSATTTKHFYAFLNQQGLGILANKKAIKKALDRGYVRLDQSIAVWLDETL